MPGDANSHEKQVDSIRQGKDISLLFISGAEDLVGRFGRGVRSVVRCYEQAGFTQIILELVARARHEVLNEHNSAQTSEKISNWLGDTG